MSNAEIVCFRPRMEYGSPQYSSDSRGQLPGIPQTNPSTRRLSSSLSLSRDLGKNEVHLLSRSAHWGQQCLVNLEHPTDLQTIMVATSCNQFTAAACSAAHQWPAILQNWARNSTHLRIYLPLLVMFPIPLLACVDRRVWPRRPHMHANAAKAWHQASTALTPNRHWPTSPWQY